MADRGSKLRLGGFVALSTAALAGLAVLFGGTPRLFRNPATYTIVFTEAPNIAPGTPVRKSGVRIGEVTAVELDGDTGKVRVGVAVDRKYLPRTTDDATVFRSLLSGDTNVDFLPKTGADGQPVTARGEVIPPGTELPGVSPISPNQLFRQASGALPNAQESMARILDSIERFEKAVPRIEKAFDEIAGLARSGREFVPELRRTNDKVQDLLAFADDPKGQPGEPATLKATLAELRDFLKTARPLAEDVRRIVRASENDITGTVRSARQTADAIADLLNPDNRKALSDFIKALQAASGDFGRTVASAASVLGEIQRLVSSANSRIVQLEKVFESADKALKNIESATRPLGDKIDPIVTNINTAADQLAKTLAELRVTLQAVNRPDGTFGRVLNDPTLYHNLNESAFALAKTLQRAERAAADLQVFADKIARRPESLGVGGAVRPNGGLKESPFAPSQGGVTPIPPTPFSPSYKHPSDLPPR